LKNLYKLLIQIDGNYTNSDNRSFISKEGIKKDSTELEQMRKANLTINDDKSKSYGNTIAKLTRFMDKGKPGNSASPSSSIAKALRNKEKKEEMKNLMLNEIANQFNLLKNTILSQGDDAEENEEQKNGEVRPSFQKNETMISEIRMAERVFWTKEKMEKIRAQLRTARLKIHEKTNRDFQELYVAIDTGQREKIL
jgi:hypothetical protein